MTRSMALQPGTCSNGSGACGCTGTSKYVHMHVLVAPQPCAMRLYTHIQLQITYVTQQLLMLELLHAVTQEGNQGRLAADALLMVVLQGKKDVQALGTGCKTWPALQLCVCCHPSWHQLHMALCQQLIDLCD